MTAGGQTAGHIRRQCLTLGPRLRVETERSGSITLLDYFESRFGDTGHRLRLLGALIIGVFVTAYVAAQLNAGAKTLSAALGWNLGLCLVLSALLILGYMVLGGYIAVAWNDVVRAVLMLLGLVALPVYGLVRVGGLAALGEVLAAVQPTALDPFRPDAGKAEPAAPDARKPGAGRSRPGPRGIDGSGS